MPSVQILKTYVERHKQAFFLGSLFALFIGDVFFPLAVHTWVTRILFIQNMLFGLIVVRQKSVWLRKWVRALLWVAVLRILAILAYPSLPGQNTVGFALSIFYFNTILVVLFVDLYRAKSLGMESIYAVFSGFILVCIAFSFVVMYIHGLDPHSFTGFSAPGQFSEYLYFSFITLLTIGYGDISPATEIARKAVLMAALIGHFYTVFITALIIGRLFR
ncbi:MAG: ion channel [Bacteroidota bacterium]